MQDSMLHQADVRKSAHEGGFRIGWRAPTQAEGGRQSSESTLNGWHEWALSLAKESVQQYHLLQGEKGQRAGTESLALQSRVKTTCISTLPRLLEQARSEHEKMKHVSYRLCNKWGKPKCRTISEELHNFHLWLPCSIPCPQLSPTSPRPHFSA